MQSKPLREIIETEEFKNKRNEIFQDTKLYDDVIIGAIFLIAKDPKEFPLVSGTNIRSIAIRQTPSTPSFKIFFREKNKEEVEFLDLILTKET